MRESELERFAIDFLHPRMRVCWDQVLLRFRAHFFGKRLVDVLHLFLDISLVVEIGLLEVRFRVCNYALYVFFEVNGESGVSENYSCKISIPQSRQDTE